MRPAGTGTFNGAWNGFATPRDRVRRVGGHVLIGLGTTIILVSGLAKLAHVQALVAPLEAAGFGGRIGMIAVMELISAAAFAFPLSRRLGLLLVTGLLGGAVATHMQHMLNPAPPAVILAICWAGAWLWEPTIFGGARRRPEAR